MIVKSIALATLLFFGSLGVASGYSYLGGSVNASTPGWHYVHASFCTGADGYYYFVAQEGGQYFYSTYLDVEIGLAPACQTGNKVAFHVYDSYGNWDQVVVWPFK